MDLPTIWFLLLGVLLAGYAILDGFDLGVGLLHLFVPGDRDRRLVLNSIGPLWDGNEVWLVTFGGALFAAFPDVYATILSAFYLPVMAILLGLIGRAISLEFRSKSRRPGWRRYWDLSFFASSFTVTFLFGVVLGNVVAGIPIGPTREFAGSVVDLFSPYALSTGGLAVAGAAMHGAIYLHLKTEGDLQRRAHLFMWVTFFVFLAFYVLVSAWTVATVAHATANFERWPAAWVIVVATLLAIANIPRAVHQNRPAYAFISSCATIAALTFLVAMALFPNLAISSLDTAYSINVWTGSSSLATLRLMGIVALIGMPLVATYTAIVYWIFRGKVQLGTNSY